MADNVDSITLDILKSIQASIAKLNERFDQVDARFDRVEAGLRKDRRNVAGMLVMMRSVSGEFDERVTEVEERLTALENRTT